MIVLYSGNTFEESILEIKTNTESDIQKYQLKLFIKL